MSYKLCKVCIVFSLYYRVIQKWLIAVMFINVIYARILVPIIKLENIDYVGGQVIEILKE